MLTTAAATPSRAAFSHRSWRPRLFSATGGLHNGAQKAALKCRRALACGCRQHCWGTCHHKARADVCCTPRQEPRRVKAASMSCVIAFFVQQHNTPNHAATASCHQLQSAPLPAAAASPAASTALLRLLARTPVLVATLLQLAPHIRGASLLPASSCIGNTAAG